MQRPTKEILIDLSKRIHQNAINHGWWESPRTWGECMALVHSEGGEATEALRDAVPVMIGADGDKPIGVVTEIADVVIRLLDACARFNVTVVDELFTVKELASAVGQLPAMARIAVIHDQIPCCVLLADPARTASEAADCILACEDVCKSFGFDLWLTVLAKHAYNLTRPYKHGRAQ